MRARHQVGRLLRESGRKLPAGFRGQAGRASRPFRSSLRALPLVTVVVPASDEDTTRIGPALDSIRAQRHRNLDILVVPFGRHARVEATAREHASDDWRVRITRRELPDLVAARDYGADKAQGEYLMFVAGGDDLLPETVDDALRVLEVSGSSFAVGRLAPPPVVGPSLAPPTGAAHLTEQHATTLQNSPVAVTDLAVGNRVFRTSFWRQSGLAFTGGGRDSEVALAAYQKASTFDLLVRPGYVPTDRRDGAAVGTVADVFSELDDWLVQQREMSSAVEALRLPAVHDSWLWGVLDAAIQPFLGDVERATDEQWRTLRDYATQVLDSIGDHAWSMLRAASRLKLWLLSHDRRADLEEYVAAGWFEHDNAPTEIVDGKVFAKLPFYGDETVGIPRDVYQMREDETPLRVVARGVRWSGPTTIELRLLAYIDYVDPGSAPDTQVWLESGGERIPLRVERLDDSDVNTLVSHRYQDYTSATVLAFVDAADLASRGGEWRLHVSSTVDGVTREGGVTSRDLRSTAGMLPSGHLAPRVIEQVRVGVVCEDEPDIRVVVRPDRGLTLSDARVQRRTLTGVLEPGAASSVRAAMADGASAKVTVSPAGEFTLELPKPWGAGEQLRWSLTAVARDGSEHTVGWPGDATQWVGIGDAEIVLSRTPEGDSEVLEARQSLVLDRIELVDGWIEAEGHWLGLAPKHVRLALRGDRTTIDARDVTSDGPVVRLRFPTRWDEWGLHETGVPVGRYYFELMCGPQHDIRGRVLLGDDLLDRLFDFTLTPEYRFRVVRLVREAGVYLMPPLADDERGPVFQNRLRRYLVEPPPLDETAVYLQSYTGNSATDSQLAIFHELRRTRPDLVCYWGIADASSWVPEGSTPVVMHTRRWFEIITSAKYLVMNIDFDRWYYRQPGQRVLQSFHGYPSKAMGVGLWETKRFTPRRIAAELSRTRDDWDLILTPTPEMDEHYRTQYRYEGEIHSQGYPRDDMLVSADAPRLRSEARERLGIRPDQTAVLYAPTWRDDLATNYRSAQLVRHLDLEAASRALGPEYVLLMRGHRFHARSGERSQSSARLLDVTHYPEINHLILAADAAVLDYSSLRFDFALTERPMVFLVPDLDTYAGGVRGFLFDFRDTAPGPLLDTADQVVAALRDLPRVQREHAADYARFNKKYNYLMDGHAAERVVKAFFA